jgi:hypothetical protein
MEGLMAVALDWNLLPNPLFRGRGNEIKNTSNNNRIMMHLGVITEQPYTI